MDYEERIAIRKARPLAFKGNNNSVELDESGRTVKIIANTLNFFDYDCDILLPGCANRSISNNGAKSAAPDKIAHLLHHDMKHGVGKSMLEAETEVGGDKVIYCESYLPETTDGEDTLIKYKVGIFNQHSMGLNYVDLDFTEKGDQNWDRTLAMVKNPEDMDKMGIAWMVKELKWWEYSTVQFGANRLTPALGIKSENKLMLADVVSKKMSILANKAMRREVKDKHAFEFELLVLQQMVYELAENGSSSKSTQKSGSEKEETQVKSVKLTGFSNLINF